MDDQKLISAKSFSPEELRKWQMKLLEILVYFRDFCESHNLRFFLAAGTCIGAVRHHGFIPWDDDLDVQMPRKDYELLFELWERDADKSRFRCERTDKNKCVKFQMGLVRSVDTTCIYDHSIDMDICQGLKIDVEFLDGVPNERWKRKINETISKLFALMRAERVPNRKSKFIKTISKVLLVMFPTHSIRYKISRILEKYLMRYDFDGDYEYVRYLSTDLRRKCLYNKAIYLDFEGYKMPVPEGYDEYLRDQYGDYTQLPPEKQRKPITDNIYFYDLDHSYQDYKGKYYCID